MRVFVCVCVWDSLYSGYSCQQVWSSESANAHSSVQETGPKCVCVFYLPKGIQNYLLFKHTEINTFMNINFFKCFFSQFYIYVLFFIVKEIIKFALSISWVLSL